MKCPWCNKAVIVPTNAFINAENYGSNWFRFKHKCGNNINICIERVVKLRVIIKDDNSNQNYAYSSDPI